MERAKKRKLGIPDITIDDFRQRNMNINSSSPMAHLETATEVALEKYEEAKNKEANDDGDDNDNDEKESFLIKKMLTFKRILKKPPLKINLNTGCIDDDHEKSFSEKGKSKPRKKALEQENVPDLPQEFQDKMEELKCSNPVLLIQKSLTKTDVEKGQSRLSIPFGQVKNHNVFLKQHEVSEISNGHGHPVEVKTFIEPSVEVSEKMVFTRWNMRKINGNESPIYALINKWNDVRERNQLKKGDVVQVWAFNDVEKKLGLALVKVSSGEGGGDGNSSTGVHDDGASTSFDKEGGEGCIEG